MSIGYILQKLPAGKWLGCNVIAWGIVTACIAGTKNYQTLLVGRIFLGIFEASISPSLMLLTSQWYTRSEAASRFQFWFFGMPIAQFIGGLISFGFQHIGPGHLAGWRIMFIALGMVTITIGVAAIFLLPDSPMAPAVKWLSEVEKVALLLHISDNRTGVENRHFKVSQLVELLFDVQIWLMGLIIILVGATVEPLTLTVSHFTDYRQITISSGVINSYSVTVIKQFGYTSKEAALLNMPTGAVSGLFTLLVGFGTRHTSHRWAWLILCCIFGVLGGGLMSYAPRHNKGALLTGVYLVNAVVPTPIIIYQLAMSNIAGHTKRAVSAVVVAGCLGIGNIIGPQTFRAKDAPEYHSAKVIVLAVQSAGASVTAVLFLYYVWANKQKERRQRILEREGVAMNTTADTWGNLTDKQNPEFRYVY